MYLEIVSPEKKIYGGDIKALKVPGSNGSFGVLKDHAPLISTLKKGEVKITDKDNKEELFEINGGVIEVLKNNIVILAKF